VAAQRKDGEMTEADPEDRRLELAGRYGAVRRLTEELAAPLSPEDQMVQSMPDASPTKWHRGHTSWFFETFLLQPGLPGYELCDPTYPYIFNSYYETIGARHPRAERGLVSRPGTTEVTSYRERVDGAMADLLGAGGLPAADRPMPSTDTLDLVELGLHHEQQHQELLLMDIKHALWRNPVHPAYTPALRRPSGRAGVSKPDWIEHQGGPAEVGSGGGGFSFDNESPRHLVQLTPFALADRPVTCGEWTAFVYDGGYTRPELWLSDGWALVQQQRWDAPLYWDTGGPVGRGQHTGGPVGRGKHTGGPVGRGQHTGAPVHTATSGDGAVPGSVFTLAGERPIDFGEPVCHVSYYEADAFARWAGARLPTEAEWEVVAGRYPVEGHLLDRAVLHPMTPLADGPGFFGDVWEWTSSAYSPYPGFRTAPGAVGEYNGKFMVNQYVLRGGSCATPPGHVRATYRNFFPAAARWAFSGVRLARDL